MQGQRKEEAERNFAGRRERLGLHPLQPQPPCPPSARPSPKHRPPSGLRGSMSATLRRWRRAIAILRVLRCSSAGWMTLFNGSYLRPEILSRLDTEQWGCDGGNEDRSLVLIVIPMFALAALPRSFHGTYTFFGHSRVLSRETRLSRLGIAASSRLSGCVLRLCALFSG